MSHNNNAQPTRTSATSTSAAILTPWDPSPPSIVPGQSDTIASFAATIDDESTDEALFFALTQQSRQVGPATLRPSGNSTRGRGAAPAAPATDAAATTAPSQLNAAGEEKSTVPKWRSTTYSHIRDASAETTGVSTSDNSGAAPSMVPPKFTSPNTSLMVQNADGDSSVWADSISFTSLTPNELYSRAYLPVQVQRRTAVEFLTGTCQCTQAIGEEGVHPTVLSPMTKSSSPGKRSGPTPRNSTSSGVKEDGGAGGGGGRPRSRSGSAAISSGSGRETSASAAATNANEPVPLDSWEQLLMDVLPMIRGPVAHHSLRGSVSIPTPPDAPASDAAAMVSPKNGDMSAEEQGVYVRRLTMVQSVWDINLSEPTPFELLSYTVGKFAALASNTMSQQRRHTTQSATATANDKNNSPKSSETAPGGLTSLLGQQRRKHRRREGRVTSVEAVNAAPDPAIILQRLMQFGFSTTPLVYFPKGVLRFLPGGSLDYGIETLISRLMAAASVSSATAPNINLPQTPTPSFGNVSHTSSSSLPTMVSSSHLSSAATSSLVRECEGILAALCGEDISNPHRHPRISYALLHGGGNTLSAHALKHQYVLNMLELLRAIPIPTPSTENVSESVLNQSRVAHVLGSFVMCIVLERASLPEILHLISTLRKVEYRCSERCSKTISGAVEGCLGRFSFRRGCGFRPGYPWLSQAASFPDGHSSASLNNKPPTPPVTYPTVPPNQHPSSSSPSSGGNNNGSNSNNNNAASPSPPTAPTKDSTETLNGIIDGYCCPLTNLNLTIPDGTTVRCFAVSNDNKYVALATAQFGICIGDLERGCITHRQETAPPLEDAAAASWESQDNLMNANIAPTGYHSSSYAGGSSIHPLRSMSSLGPVQHHELSKSVVISAEHFALVSGPCWSVCISPNNNEVLFTATGLKTHVRISLSSLEVLEVATLPTPMIPSYSLIPVPSHTHTSSSQGVDNDNGGHHHTHAAAAFSTGAAISVSLPSLEPTASSGVSASTTPPLHHLARSRQSRDLIQIHEDYEDQDDTNTTPGGGGGDFDSGASDPHTNTFLPAVESTPVVSPTNTALPPISSDNDAPAAGGAGPPASLIEVLERRQDQSHDNIFSPETANLLFNHNIQSMSTDDPLSMIRPDSDNGGVGGNTTAIVSSGGGQSSTSNSRNNTLSSVSSTRPSSASRSGAPFTNNNGRGGGGGTASRGHGGLKEKGAMQEILTFHTLPTLPRGHLESTLFLGGTRGGYDMGGGSSRRFVSPGFVIRDISKGIVDEIVSGGSSSPVEGGMMMRSTAALSDAAVRRSYVNNTLLQSSSSTHPASIFPPAADVFTSTASPNNNNTTGGGGGGLMTTTTNVNINTTNNRLLHSYFHGGSDRPHSFPHVVSVGNPVVSLVDGHIQPNTSGSPPQHAGGGGGNVRHPHHHGAAATSSASPPRNQQNRDRSYSVDAMSTSGSSWVGNTGRHDEDRPFGGGMYRSTHQNNMLASNDTSVSPPPGVSDGHHRLAQLISPLQQVYHQSIYSPMAPPVTSTTKQVSLVSGYVDQLNISAFLGDDFFGTLLSVEGGFSVHIKQNSIIECYHENGDSVVGTLPRCSSRDNTDGTIWRFLVVSWNKGQFTAIVNSQFIELHDVPNTSVVSERRELRTYMCLTSTSVTFLMSTMGHVSSLHFWAGPAPRCLLTSLAVSGRYDGHPPIGGGGDLNSSPHNGGSTTTPTHHNHHHRGGPSPKSAASASQRSSTHHHHTNNNTRDNNDIHDDDSISSSLFSSTCSSDVSDYDPLEDCMLLAHFPLDEGSGLWVGECVRGDVHLLTTHSCATWDSSAPSPLDVCPLTSDEASQISPYLLKRADVLDTLKVDTSLLNNNQHQVSSSTPPSTYLPATIVRPSQGRNHKHTNLYGRRHCHLPISVVSRSRLLRSKDQMILLYDDSVTANNSFSQHGISSLTSGGAVPLTRYALHLTSDLTSMTRIARLKTSAVTQYSTLFALDNKGKFAYSFSQRFLSLSRAEVRSVYLACDEVRHWGTVITEKRNPPTSADDEGGVSVNLNVTSGRLPPATTSASSSRVVPSSSGFHNPFGMTLHGQPEGGTDASSSSLESSSVQSNNNIHNASTTTRGYDTSTQPDISYVDALPNVRPLDSSAASGGTNTPHISTANNTGMFTAAVPPNVTSSDRRHTTTTTITNNTSASIVEMSRCSKTSMMIAPPLGYIAEPMNACSWLSHRVCAVVAIESYDLVMAPPELSHISIDLLHHLIGQLQTVAAEALDVRRDREAFIAVTDGHWTMRMFALARLILHSVQHFCNDRENRSSPTTTTRRATTATTVEAAAVKAISTLRPLCWRLLESKSTDNRLKPLANVLSEIQWLVLARSLTPVQKAHMIIKGLTSKPTRDPDSLASSFSATHSPGNSPPQSHAPTPQRRSSVSDPMVTPDTPLLLSWLKRGSIEGIIDATIASEPNSTDKITSLITTVVDYTMNPKSNSHSRGGGGSNMPPSSPLDGHRPYNNNPHSRNLSTISGTSSILPKHPTPTLDASWALIAAVVSAGDRNRQDVVVSLVDILLERCDSILSQICDVVSAVGNHHRDPTDEDDIRSRSQDHAQSHTFLTQVILSCFIPFFVTVARKCPGWINEEQQADIRDLFHAASTAMVDQSLAPPQTHPSAPPSPHTPVSIAFQCRQVYDVVTARNDAPWRIALDSNKTKEIALTIGGDSAENLPPGPNSGRRILFVPSVASTTATTAPALRECAPWGNNRATFVGDGTLVISGNGNVSMSVVRLYNKSVVWDPVSILCASLRHLQNRVVRALFSGAGVVAQGWDAPCATSRREVNLLPILKFGLKSRTLASYGIINSFGEKEGPLTSPRSPAAAAIDRSFTSSTFDGVGTTTAVQPPAAAILTATQPTNLMGSGATTPTGGGVGNGGLPPLSSSGNAGCGSGCTAALDILYGRGYMKSVVDAAVAGMRGLIIPSMRPAFQALLAVLVHCGSTIPQAEEELKFKWLGGEWGLWLQGNNKKASMTRLISLCDWIINNVSYPSAASLLISSNANAATSQSLSSRERELSGDGSSGRRDKSGSSRSAFESMHRRRRSSGSSRRSTLRVHHNLSSEILDHVRSLFISGVAPEAIERRAVSRTLYALHCCRGHRILKDMVHSTVAIAKSVCPTHGDGIYVDLSKTPIDRTTLDFAISSLVCFAEMPPEPFSSELSSLASRKWLDVGSVSPSGSPNMFDDNASASMTMKSVSSASGGGPEFEPSTSSVRHFPERLVGCGIGLELGVREEFIRSCFIVKRIVAQCTIPNMVALDKPFCTKKKTVDGALNAASIGAPQLLKVLSVVCVGFDAVDMQLMQQMITTAFREEEGGACSKTNSSSANNNHQHNHPSSHHQRRGTDSSDNDHPLRRRKQSSRVFWNGFGEGSSRRTSRLQNSWRMQTESDLPTSFVPTTAVTANSFGAATSPSRRNRAEGTSIFFDPTVENFPHHSATTAGAAAASGSINPIDEDTFFQTINFGVGLGSEHLGRSTDSTNTITCNIPSFSSDDAINAEDSTYYGFINVIRCVMGVVVQSMSEEPVLPGLDLINEANHADLQTMMSSRYDISSLARVFPNCFNLVVPGLKIQSINEGWRVHGNPSPSASSVAAPKRVDPVSHEVCHILPENGWPLDVIPKHKNNTVGRIDGDFTGLPGVYYYEVTITHGCPTSIGIVAGGDYTLHLTQLVPADTTTTGPGRPADGEAVPMPSAPIICAYNSDGSVTGSCVVFPSAAAQARPASPTTNVVGEALHQWPRYGTGDTIGVGIIPSSMHVFLTLNSLYLGVVGTWNPPFSPEGDEGEIEELEKVTSTTTSASPNTTSTTPPITRFQKTHKEYVRPLLCVPKTPSIAEQPDFIVNFGSTAPFAFDFRFLHPLLFTPETAPPATTSSTSIHLGSSRHVDSFSASYTFPEVPTSPTRGNASQVVVPDIPLRLRPFASWQFIADACGRLIAFVSELLGNFHQVQAQSASSGMYNQSCQALVVASDCIDLIATNLQSTTCDTPMLVPSQLSSRDASTTSPPTLRSSTITPNKAPIAIYDGLLQQCISVLHRLIPIFTDVGTKFIVVTFRALQKLLRVPHPSLQMSAACAIAPLLTVISNVITTQRSCETVADGSSVSAEEVRDFIKTVCDLSCPTEQETGKESHFVTAPRANYSHFIRQMHQTGKNDLAGQLRCSELVPFTPLWCRCDPRYVTVLHPQFAKMLPDAQRTILMGSVLPRSGICSFTVSICRSDMPKGHCLKGGYFIGIALSNIAPLSPSTNTQSWKSARPPIVWALHDTSAQLPHAVNPTVQPNNFQRTFGSGDVITVVVNRDKCTVAFYRDRIFLKELFCNIPSDLDVAPFVQLYNSDAAAVLYPGFSTTVVTPAIFMSSLCCGILRSMLTLEPFRSPAAQILCSELALKAKAGEVPLTTLSVFGSLPDIRDLTLTFNEKQFAQDGGTEGVARVRLSRIGCRGQEIVVVSSSGEQYFGNVSSLKLPLVQRLPGFHLPSSNSPADFVAAVAAATAPQGGTTSTPSQDEGFEKLLVQLLDFMSDIVHPLVEGDAISTVERQVRISILKEEKTTWDGYKHDIRRYAFKAIQRSTSVPIQPVPCPHVACTPSSTQALSRLASSSSSAADGGLPARIPGPAVKVLNPAPPLQGYAFSAGLSHPAYLFPPSFCGRLATVPSGCGVEEIPFVAIAEPAVPKTGKFSIRCQLIRGHAGQMLGGGYFFGICCGTLRWDRRELNSTPPEVWALPDVEDNPWKLRHSANERPLTLARPSPRCVIVSGDTVRLEIDREEGTMHAYRTPNNTTEEVSIGLVFDNIPKGETLYPFVQMYNCDAVASLVSDDPRGYSLRSTVQYPEMAHSLASESSTSSKRVCDSCLAAYLETKLTSPNWYKCIECADYNLCQPCFFRYKHVHHNFAQMNPSTLLLSPRRPRILAEGMHVVAPSSGVEFLTCSAETVSVSEAKCFLRMDARDNKGGGCAVWGLTGGFNPCFTITANGPNNRTQVAAGGSGSVTSAMSKRILLPPAPSTTTSTSQNSFAAAASDGLPGAHNIHLPPFASPVFVGIAPFLTCRNKTPDEIVALCSSSVTTTMSSDPESLKYPEVLSYCSDPRIRCNFQEGSASLSPHGFSEGSIISFVVDATNNTAKIYRDWVCVGMQELPPSWRCLDANNELPTSSLVGFVAFSCGAGVSVVIGNPVAPFLEGVVEKAYPDSNTFLVRNQADKTKCAIVSGDSIRMVLKPCNPAIVQKLLSQFKGESTRGRLFTVVDSVLEPCHLKALEQTQQLVTTDQGRTEMAPVFVATVVTAESGTIYRAPETLFCSEDDIDSDPCPVVLAKYSRNGGTVKDAFVISRILLIIMLMLDSESGAMRIGNILRKHMHLLSQLGSVVIANNAPLNYVLELRAAIASTAKVLNFTEDRLAVPLPPLISRVVGGMAHRNYTTSVSSQAAYNPLLLRGGEYFAPSPATPNTHYPSILFSVVSGQYAGCCLLVGGGTTPPVVTEVGVVGGSLVYCAPNVSSEIQSMVKTHTSVLVDEMCCVPALQSGGNPWWLVENGLTSSRFEHVLRSRSITGGGSSSEISSDILTSTEGEWLGEFSTTHPQAATQTVALSLTKTVKSSPDGIGLTGVVTVRYKGGRLVRGKVEGHHQRYTRRLVLVFTCPALNAVAPQSSRTPLTSIQEVVFHFNGTIDADGTGIRGSWKQSDGTLGNLQLISLARMALVHSHRSIRRKHEERIPVRARVEQPGGVGSEAGHQRETVVACPNHSVPPLFDILEPTYEVNPLIDTSTTLQRMVVLLSRHICVLYSVRCGEVFGTDDDVLGQQIVNFHGHPLADSYVFMQYKLRGFSKVCSMIAQAGSLVNHPDCKPWNHASISQLILGAARVVGAAELAEAAPGVYWDGLHSIVGSTLACGTIYRHLIVERLVQYIRLAPPGFLDHHYSALLTLLDPLVSWLDLKTSDPVVVSVARDVSSVIELIMCINPSVTAGKLSRLPLYSLMCLRETAKAIHNKRPVPAILDVVGLLPLDAKPIDPQCVFGNFVSGELRVGKIMSTVPAKSVFASQIDNREVVPLDPSASPNGKYYYEVQLPERLAAFAIGWGTSNHSASPGSHVGTDTHSFAFTGVRVNSCGVRVEDYRIRDAVVQGSVIGCMLDTVEGTVGWSVNGVCGPSLPIPITLPKTSYELYPFVSTGSCGGLKIHLSALDFKRAPIGYADTRGYCFRSTIPPFDLNAMSPCPPRGLKYYVAVADYLEEATAGSTRAIPIHSTSTTSTHMIGGAASSSSMPHLSIPPPINTLPNDSLSGNPLNASSSEKRASERASVVGFDSPIIASSPIAEMEALQKYITHIRSIESCLAICLPYIDLNSARKHQSILHTIPPPAPTPAFMSAGGSRAPSPSNRCSGAATSQKPTSGCFTAAAVSAGVVEGSKEDEELPYGDSLAECFMILRSVIRPSFRQRLIDLPPVERVSGTPMSVTIRCTELHSAKARTPEVAVEKSLLRQLYVQIGHYTAKQFAQSPLCSVLLHLTESGHTPQDLGGPYRQMWTEICEEIMRHPDTCFPHTTYHRNPLFRFSNNSKRLFLVPDFEANTHLELALFVFLGKIMGHMVRAKTTPLALDISPYVWKHLVEEPVSINDYYTDVDSVVQNSMEDPDFLFSELADEVIPNFAENRAKLMQNATGGMPTGSLSFSATQRIGGGASTSQKAHHNSMTGSTTTTAAHLYNNSMYASSFRGFKPMMRAPPNHHGSPVLAAAQHSTGTRSGVVGGGAQRDLGISQGIPETPTTSHSALPHVTTTAYDDDGCSIAGSPARTMIGFTATHTQHNEGSSSGVSVFSGIPLSAAAHGVDEGLGGISPANSGASPPMSSSVNPPAYTQSPPILRRLVQRHSSVLSTGSEVTTVVDEEELEFRRHVAAYSLVHSMDEQIAHLQKGLWSVVPRRITRCLRWQDLEVAVCGKSTPTSAELRPVFQVALTAPRDLFFWKIVEDMTGAQRAQLLCFASGQTRLPLASRIQVLENSESLTHLPRAQSCSFLITIPRYDDFNVMKAKLMMAITTSSAMELA